jgi:translation initiation factor 3 subunit A
LKYSRKNELRRLGDLLRNHLANIPRFAHQAHSINLNNPKSLQRLLEIRFGFLNAAAELELWQEAYRTIEEINNLLVMSKKPPKMFMMANYYEKLTKIFRVSSNHLFHAAAWNKFFTIQKTHNPQITPEEIERFVDSSK